MQLSALSPSHSIPPRAPAASQRPALCPSILRVAAPRNKSRFAAGRAQATTRADIAAMHEFEHWPVRWMWPMTIAFVLLQSLAARENHNLLADAAVDLARASARSDVRLRPELPRREPRATLSVHWLNELHGHIVGTFSFMPLAVYRYAHARHHAQLGREGDPELWPFNSPRVSRPLRSPGRGGRNLPRRGLHAAALPAARSCRANSTRASAA